MCQSDKPEHERYDNSSALGVYYFASPPHPMHERFITSSLQGISLISNITFHDTAIVRQYNEPFRKKLRLAYMPNEDLWKVYNASDLLVLPSLELFPNFAVLESLTCGTPVIFSSPKGEREFTGDGYAGFYVPFGNIRGLANKIVERIEQPWLLAIFSNNALKLVEQRFDMMVIANKWNDIYQSVLGKEAYDGKCRC